METVLLSGGMLSRFILIKSNEYSGNGHVYLDKDGFARLGEESVFSPHVKIEAERATSDARYVNLRFCHSNKYWQLKERFIVAESNKPEEDTTKPWCTLFEAVGGNGSFYLKHVESGGRVVFDGSNMLRLLVSTSTSPTPDPTAGYLSSVNWDTLVKLPEHVAFKGYHGYFLHAFRDLLNNFLMFKGDDPNDVLSGHRVSLMPDGHVRINSDQWGTFWRRSPDRDWIWADSTDTTPSNIDTLFWPVKLDDSTIALRSAGNAQFCKRYTDEGLVSCLRARDINITNEARIGVQELVRRRRIYNVRYRMEDSRIFNETPYLAGTTTAYNYGDEEAGIEVEVLYSDTKSYSLTRSLSLSAGVTTTIEFGVPLISNASISVSYEISTTLEWNHTTTTTTSITAKGSVPVPPRSLATVHYVATMGSCDVPFSYTQQDTSSTNGAIIESEQIDGVFRGVNAYNFSFVVEKTQPLS